MIQSKLCDLLGITYPVFQGGMAWIADGKLAVIETNHVTHRRLVSVNCFDLTDSDSVFGAPGFREAVAKIEAPKSLWAKLTGKRLQYDIYDWRTHRQIVK